MLLDGVMQLDFAALICMHMHTVDRRPHNKKKTLNPRYTIKVRAKTQIQLNNPQHILHK